MDYKRIIDLKVSFQPSVWSELGEAVSIADVIRSIKRGAYSHQINKLRWFLKNGDSEAYNMHKKRLPGVTFCGLFDTRRQREFLKKYTSLLVLDIDKLSLGEMVKVFNVLKEDPYVFTFWASPSNNGYKGLIHLEYNFVIKQFGIDLSHKWAFEQVRNHFLSQYDVELDLSGSDTTRLCFLSYDPKLEFKTSFSSFKVNPGSTASEINKQDPKEDNEALSLDALSKEQVLHINNPIGRNNQRNKRTLINIIKYLKKTQQSITSTYDNWYRVAFAIASSFTYNVGSKLYLELCSLDGPMYNDEQSRRMILYCYLNNRNEIKFNTIAFLAKEKGFKL